MAKFANKNQEQVIPTAEQNQAELLALQKNSQRLIDLQTDEYINQKIIENPLNKVKIKVGKKK